jgi:threonine dehydrogenase-like Zn-dependent dehydrogenase
MNAVVRAGGQACLARVPSPGAKSGWVLLRVLLTGICRTDLYAADGSLPVAEGRILGHELVGELEDGGHATVSPVLACGDCAACRSHQRCFSPKMLGVGVDGGFAEYVVVPEACVHRVPKDLPLRRAAYVEPVAASLAVLRAPIRPEQRGLVLGAGRITSLTVRILEARGFSRLTVRDAEAPVEDGAFDFVIETAATSSVLDAALRSVRPGGVVVLKSRPPERTPLDVARAVQKDVTLAAVSYASFEEAIALVAELAVDDLLGDAFPLERFEAAFARAREPGSPKLFLAPAGDT